jgi:hypothetical protein
MTEWGKVTSSVFLEKKEKTFFSLRVIKPKLTTKSAIELSFTVVVMAQKCPNNVDISDKIWQQIS